MSYRRVEEHVEFDTEEHMFVVYRLRGIRTENTVQIRVDFKDQRNLSDREIASASLNEVRSILEQLGKWEAFVNAGRTLLGELGLNMGE